MVSKQSALTAAQTVTIHLNKIPLLAGVDAETLAQVAAVIQIRTVERGHYVLHKGSVGDYLLFVLTGRLQAVDPTEDGREVGLNFLAPGDYFGELSVIDGLPRSASVVASENSMIALLPRAQALTLIYNTPNAFQRVFALLNQFTEVAPGGLVLIQKMPTQQEIASMTNTSRETVSRAIHILIQKGVVEKDMRRLIVRHPEALRKAITAVPELKNQAKD